MDNKTPDNFWNDELVKEFVEGAIRVQDSMHHEVSLDLGILHFKKSKEHKVEEKRAEILDFRKMPDNKVELHSMYCFALRGFIPQEKYEAVKQAIERELNNDTVVEDKIVFDGERVNKYLIDEFGQTGKTEPLRFYSHKRYSQSEVDAIRKEAFEAGRGRYVNQSNGETLYDYPTIQDYISSSKPPNNEPLSDSIPTLERQFSEPKVYNQNGQQLNNIDWGNTICTTKEKLDAMMKSVWDAARKATPLYDHIKYHYFDFKEYQESLPENKPQESKQDSKGWIIESFRGIGNNNKGLFTLDKLDGLYYFDTWKENKVEGMALHEMNYDTSAKSVEIFQVRRLSDGEVFSVGDKVNCDKCPESFSQQTIEKFQLGHSGVMIASCAGVATSINNISKLPLTEQPKPRQMWNKHTGIHDESVLCTGMKCQEYNPLNKEHK